MRYLFRVHVDRHMRDMNGQRCHQYYGVVYDRHLMPDDVDPLAPLPKEGRVAATRHYDNIREAAGAGQNLANALACKTQAHLAANPYRSDKESKAA